VPITASLSKPGAHDERGTARPSVLGPDAPPTGINDTAYRPFKDFLQVFGRKNRAFVFNAELDVAVHNTTDTCGGEPRNAPGGVLKQIHEDTTQSCRTSELLLAPR
jgi:hypothetical protein